jgi:hypothetical protein
VSALLLLVVVLLLLVLLLLLLLHASFLLVLDGCTPKYVRVHARACACVRDSAHNSHHENVDGGASPSGPSPRSSDGEGGGSSPPPPFSPTAAGSSSSSGFVRRGANGRSKRKSRARKGQRAGDLDSLNRTASSRDYGEGVDLIPVVRVESSPELYGSRGSPPPPFSPSPQAGRSGRKEWRGGGGGGGGGGGRSGGGSSRRDASGRLRNKSTSLMPAPHLSPNRNNGRGARAGAPSSTGAAAAAPPAVVYDPFMTEGDHTALGTGKTRPC